MLVAGLAAAPAEPPADVSDASFQPASQATTTEQASVSFRFLAREEGHEVMLTDVHVTIADPVRGTLVDTVSNGPFLVAFVPAGRYEVAASYEGKVRRMSLTIARAEPRNVALYW